MKLIERLREAEGQILTLLEDEDAWESLDINYHPPFVERLWRPWGDFRLFLHRIFPCPPEDALFHRHPWPSAIRVINGQYEMGFAYGEGPGEGAAPPAAARMIFTGGSAYEMTDALAWHYVAPLDKPSLSLMLTGDRWGKGSHKPDYRLSPLQPQTKTELLSLFREYYESTHRGS